MKWRKMADHVQVSGGFMFLFPTVGSGARGTRLNADPGAEVPARSLCAAGVGSGRRGAGCRRLKKG